MSRGRGGCPELRLCGGSWLWRCNYLVQQKGELRLHQRNGLTQGEQAGMCMGKGCRVGEGCLGPRVLLLGWQVSLESGVCTAPVLQTHLRFTRWDALGFQPQTIPSTVHSLCPVRQTLFLFTYLHIYLKGRVTERKIFHPPVQTLSNQTTRAGLS